VHTVEQDGEYTYVTVRNVIVTIKEEDEGVIVDFFARDDDSGETINSAWVSYRDAEIIEDEES
jgi:hypothetical protein